MGDISGRIYQDNISGKLVTKIYMADTAVTASYAISGPGASNSWDNLTDVPDLISGSSQVDHNATTNYAANDHIDWTQDQGGTLINSANYVATASVESASFANTANTANTAHTASYYGGSVTSASYAPTKDTVISGSSQVDYDNIQNQPTLIDSASYATTASFALNAGESVPAGTVSSSIQIDHDSTTNYEANQHYLQSAITEVGVVITGDVSAIITGDTVLSSSYSVTASYAANASSPTWDTVTGKPEGIVSSSDQVSYDGITDVPIGIISASEQVDYNNISNQPTLIDSSSYSEFALTASFALNAGESVPAGTVSSSVQVDHDQTTNYDADEHFLLSAITEVGTVTVGDVSAILPSGIISGSLIESSSYATVAQTVLGGIENANTASYVDYTNVDNKPTLISGSSQVSYNGITDVPTGIFSASEQVDYDSIQNQPTLIDSASYVLSSSYASVAETLLGSVVSASHAVLADTGSFVEYADVANKPLLPEGIISGSGQVVMDNAVTASYANNFDIVYSPVSESYATTMSIDNSAFNMTYATASANFHITFTSPTLLNSNLIEVRYLAADCVASFETGIALTSGTQQSGSGQVDYFLASCTNTGGEYILTILNR